MKQKKNNTTKREDTRIDILMAENGYRKDVDLARDLGMSPQALYNKISGSISMRTINELAAHFKVDIKKMFK